MADIPHLRTSERRSFKRCPAQWHWSYRQGLVLKRSRADARWLGTGLHLALAERYKYPGLQRGKNVLKVWRDYVGEETARVVTRDDFDELEWVDAKELGEAMLGGYLDRYGMDERWWVVSTEQTFQTLINRPGTDTPIVEYDGTFDGVRRDQENADSLWLWENKSAAQIRTGHLPMDPQAGSYWAVAPDWLAAQGIEFSGKFEGIMYDFLRKAKPTDEDKLDADGVKRNLPKKQHYIDAVNADEDLCAAALINEFDLSKLSLPKLVALADEWGLTVLGDVSKSQPTPLFERVEVWRTRAERNSQIKSIQNEALHMEAMRTGALPIYKNPTPDCSWCDFREMCELHEVGADYKQFRDAMFTRRDPYADHRYDVGE